MSSIDFCSDCHEIWPKLSYQPPSTEFFDRPFGDGEFAVHYKGGDYSDCCNAELTSLDFDTHVDWILDLAAYIKDFQCWDETLEARAVFCFEDAFSYGLVHDWFGFDASLELARTASIVSNPNARWDNRLHEWISDLLEETCDYDNANKDSTKFGLKFNAEEQTMTITWTL